jgi:nucleoside-diphosphate-sugar epimerase
MSTNSLLLLGASGQVGGALLSLLRKQHSSLPITVFLRTQALDSAIQTLPNMTIIHGDFGTPEGLSSLEAAVSKHSITINSATSSNVAVNQAILRGLNTYKATTQRKAILIHLSGAGNFADNSTTGDFNSSGEVAGLALPFHDTDVNAVSKINAHHVPNGACDEIIMAFAHQGKANAYFVCPVGIHGASANHIGLAASTPEGKKYAQAPGVWAGFMAAIIKKFGFNPIVGPGKNIFYTIHVDDVVSLTLLVLEKAVRERDNESYKPKDVYSNFYIAAGEKHTMTEISGLFAKAAGSAGAAKGELEVRSVKFEDAGPLAMYLAGNMLIVPENAEKLGWKVEGKSLEGSLLG